MESAPLEIAPETGKGRHPAPRSGGAAHVLQGLRFSREAIAVLIAVKLAILFAFAWHILFVMDEFGQLGFAKYLGNGMFDQVQPAKALGATVFFKLAHLIGHDAASILLAGRMMTAVLACATLALIYACARALGQDRFRALLVLLILLSFSNFIERIFRTIAEPVSVFFAAAALLMLLRGNPDRVRTVLVTGFLSGLAFLATQKGVYFNLAMGLALVGDAAVTRRYAAAFRRGALLVAGWSLAIAGYCLAFGGLDPLPVAESLVFGPVEVATRGGAEYGGLRHFVGQTLARNALLYAICFSGMGLAVAKLPQLDRRTRIALLFSAVITVLVFAHDQPWPYVFVMALPFVALWGPPALDRVPGGAGAAAALLLAAVALSLFRNATYFDKDNRAQLQVVERAEALLRPDETYFDGIGMLPNRGEPSTLWLDRLYVLRTLAQGDKSEAFRIVASGEAKLIIWSYRMKAIAPVIDRQLRLNYVHVAPNVWLAGHRLGPGRAQRVHVATPSEYGLYSLSGTPLDSPVKVDGRAAMPPFALPRGSVTIEPNGGKDVLLLPRGSYEGLLKPGSEDLELFAGTYD